MNQNIALQLYSIRERLETDLPGSLKTIQEQGYQGVELAGTYGLSAYDWKNCLSAYGLAPVSAHVALHEFQTDIRETIAYYHEIGCGYLALPWLDEATRPGGEAYSKTVELIAEIAAECKKSQMELLYHNHDFEFQKNTSGGYLLDTLYETNPAIKAELDTCWVDASGVDPAAYLLKYKGRCPVLHLKDYQRTEENEVRFQPLGTGKMDLPAVIAAAKQAGTQWFVVEQDQHYGEDEFEHTGISISYLKTYGRETDSRPQ